MKEFSKESQYINEMLSYESEYRAAECTDYSCPPIVIKLLLDIRFFLRNCFFLLGFLLGSFLGSIISRVFIG